MNRSSKSRILMLNIPLSRWSIIVRKPILERKLKNWVGPTGLVKRYASCFVGIWNVLTNPTSIISLTKWQSNSMWLVLLWNIGFDSNIKGYSALLSQYKEATLCEIQLRTSEENSNIHEEHWSILKQDTYSLACFDLNKHLNIMKKQV